MDTKQLLTSVVGNINTAKGAVMDAKLDIGLLHDEEGDEIELHLDSIWNDLDDEKDRVVRLAKSLDAVNEKWSDDPDNDLWKRNSDGTFQRDEKGNKIPISFKDDLNELKAKLSSLGSDVKAKIAAFLFGDKVATAVTESDEDNVLRGDENWVPQSADEVSKKAESVRDDLETLVEKLAALQIYCAEHTEDRKTFPLVETVMNAVQGSIDTIDDLIEQKQFDNDEDEEVVELED